MAVGDSFILRFRLRRTRSCSLVLALASLLHASLRCEIESLRGSTSQPPPASQPRPHSRGDRAHKRRSWICPSQLLSRNASTLCPRSALAARYSLTSP